MIAYVEGVLVKGGTDAVVAVAGGGVGLDVLLSARSAERLPAPGERVRLWTHLAVREDGWTLFGFPDERERGMFRLLISVAGVGPKLALNMLSGAAPEAIANYLRLGDEQSLTRLPGIGKKMAARLVVELGQRLPPPAPADAAAAGGQATRELGRFGEAIAVLGALGLAPIQAETLLREARDQEPQLTDDLEAWVRQALARLPVGRAR